MKSDRTEEMEEGVEVSVEAKSTDPVFLWEAHESVFSPRCSEWIRLTDG